MSVREFCDKLNEIALLFFDWFISLNILSAFGLVFLGIMAFSYYLNWKEKCEECEEY